MNHMAIDQWGETLHDLGPWPRKGLLERTGFSSAEKMYVDRKGTTYHTGYVIGDHWWTVFEVKPWENES